MRDGEARRLTSERFSTACRHHDGKHNHSDSKYEYLNLVCHGPRRCFAVIMTSFGFKLPFSF